MTMKIAISLPDELVAMARRAVERGEAASVSSFIASTMEQHGRYTALDGLLADMASDGGPPSKADRAWARDVLGLA